MLFIWLLFAHFIGDFALQTDFMIKYKGKFWVAMVAHVMTYTGIIALVSFIIPFSLWFLPLIAITHYWVDYKKMKIIENDNHLITEPTLKGLVIIDQLIHICVLLLIVLIPI
jgi:hypothetical protein